MLKQSLVTALLLLPVSAMAESDVMATLTAHSGSLAPPFAWSVEVTVSADGWVTVTRCAGYETEAPACKAAEGAAVSDGVEGILRAAKASQLADRPAIARNPPKVGGAWTSGTVFLRGGTIDLIAQPIEADEPRVQTVLAAIVAAMPETLLPVLAGD